MCVYLLVVGGVHIRRQRESALRPEARKGNKR